jgi:predicted nucleotidyltransferase
MPAADQRLLDTVTARLCEVSGVVAVALGGSYARGIARHDSDLDVAIYYADVICAAPRCDALRARMKMADVIDLPGKWRALVIAGGTVSRNYLLRLLDRIEVRENEITIVPRTEFAPPIEDQKKNAPL